MKVSNIKVKLNPDVMAKLNSAADRAMELTAQFILSDIVSRAVVPKDTGELERTGFVDKVNGMVYKIMFDTPYARRWYFNLDGAKFQKTKNAYAQDHWMDYYLDGDGKQFVVDTFVKFWQEESGGIIK